jgi:hypothetical protein
MVLTSMELKKIIKICLKNEDDEDDGTFKMHYKQKPHPH